jgi:hypothetical protein
MTLLEKFITQVKDFLTKSSESSDAEKVIKFYENQGPHDFSFPTSLAIWRRYIKDMNDDVILKYKDDILLYAFDTTQLEPLHHPLVKESSHWVFAIDRVVIEKGRCSFNLNRASAFCVIITEIYNDSRYGKSTKVPGESVALKIEDCSDTSSITQFRLQLINSVCENLLEYSRFELASDSANAKHSLLFTTKSNASPQDNQRNDKKVIICGVILDPTSKKTSSVTSEDYIKMRCDDMHLIAIHKYGVRAKDDAALQNLVKKLGRNAATLDLLGIKSSSSCCLTADPKQAFIL